MRSLKIEATWGRHYCTSISESVTEMDVSGYWHSKYKTTQAAQNFMQSQYFTFPKKNFC